MKVIKEHNGYLICQTTSGGPAGKSFNKTASIKVMAMDEKTQVSKYFSFWAVSEMSKRLAIQNAEDFIDYELNRKHKK